MTPTLTSSTPKSSTSGTPRKRTQGKAVIAWIETHCVLTNGRWRGKPFRLLPWQKRLILELFEVKPDGRRKHRWAYISVPKKNGKTELMAALALWFLIDSGEPAPLVVVAAGSDDQADLLYDAARTMAEESPTLSQICETGESLITVPSIPGSRLQRVAASARRHGSNLDGKNIYVVICDELHVWEGERGRVVWGTLTRGTVAREDPFVIQITTAGFDRETICYEQYQHAKKCLDDRDYDPEFFPFIVEADPEAPYDDPAVWEAANPSYGVVMGEDYYRGQLTKQPENEFRRFYLNQWTRSAESWLPAGAWDSCNRPDLEIPDGAPITVGVDVALYRDHTAVVWCHRNEDGVAIMRCKTWEPPADGTGIDIPDVMQFIRDLSLRYEIRGVSFDPRFFDVPAKMLADEGLLMVEQPQGPALMVPACGYAFEQIVAGLVAHDGDFTLTEHVMSAAQRASESGWTLSKGRSRHVIDACIAMVLALWMQNDRTAPAPSFFGGWS